MPRLFLDLDGTFADFDGGVHHHLGKWPWEIDAKALWAGLNRVRDFYFTLRPMLGAYPMWDAFKAYRPTFLTGLPLPEGEMANAAEQKERWVRLYYGTAPPVIACFSKDKSLHCGHGDVLVDDWDRYANLWTAAGGTFVHHVPQRFAETIETVHRLMRGDIGTP